MFIVKVFIVINFPHFEMQTFLYLVHVHLGRGGGGGGRGGEGKERGDSHSNRNHLPNPFKLFY